MLSAIKVCTDGAEQASGGPDNGALALLLTGAAPPVHTTTNVSSASMPSGQRVPPILDAGHL